MIYIIYIFVDQIILFLFFTLYTAAGWRDRWFVVGHGVRVAPLPPITAGRQSAGL